MIKSHKLSGSPFLRLFFFKIISILLVTSFLTGCPGPVTQSIEFDETKSSQYYLSQVTNSSSNEKIDWQLMAIRSLIIEGNLTQAGQLLNQVPSQLSQSQQNEKKLLEGELAVKNNKKFDLNTLSLSDLNENQKIRYLKVKIRLDGQKHDLNAQIRDYIQLEEYGTTKQRHEVINDTWNFLNGLDKTQISRITVYSNESVLQGWIDLIYAYRNSINVEQSEEDDAESKKIKEQLQLNKIKNAIHEWLIQYSNHPAALYLPRNIYGDKYRLPDEMNHKNIALFLPLSGSSKIFGDVIERGYMDEARYYVQESQQNTQTYDTNSDSIENLVMQAQQNGAELIVGPLLKQDVVKIIQSSVNIPILALNKIESSDLRYNNDKQICFFALSPDDEAMDAALHIYHQGKKYPLLILPNNDLGHRVANSFSQQWNSSNPDSQGVYAQYFESEKELSKQMNSGKGIELEGSLVNSNTDINPQQGQPYYDAIYIYASYEELTLLKSMLEMKSHKVQLNGEGKAMINPKNGKQITKKKVIPIIYTSSRSNISNATQDFRLDMDNVQFSDIPLITKHDPKIDDLPDYIKNDYSLIRLYAMGMDAWQLANRFDQLKINQMDIINGSTGQLSVGKQCEITRSLSWIKYQNGEEAEIN